MLGPKLSPLVLAERLKLRPVQVPPARDNTFSEQINIPLLADGVLTVLFIAIIVLLVNPRKSTGRRWVIRGYDRLALLRAIALDIVFSTTAAAIYPASSSYRGLLRAQQAGETPGHAGRLSTP